MVAQAAAPAAAGSAGAAGGSGAGMTALAQGVGEGAKGFMSMYAAKRAAKEQKRRTLADLLNAALQREFEAGEGGRKRGVDLATARANAMQNLASQYVQALR